METEKIIDADYGRRWLKILGLVFLVIAAGELLCRSWDVYDSWAKYNRLLLKTVSYRDQSFSISKPKDVLRVLVFGGSATYDPTDDYHDSWPHLTQQILAKKLGQKVEVINMGFFSEASTDELAKLHDFGLELNPDVVVIFDGSNDAYNLWMHHEPGMKLFNDKARHILGKKKKHSIFTELRGKLKKESSLYQRLNRGLKWIQKKLSLLVLRVRESDAVIPALPAEKDGVSAEQKQEDEKKTAQKPVFEDEANWDAIYRDYLMLYESNLDKIGRLLKMHGIDGVFIFQPDLSYKQQVSALHFEDEKQEYLKIIQGNDEQWQRIMKKAYPRGIAIMKNVSAEYGMAMADFNEALFVRRPGNYADFFDGYVHFSNEGRPVIAEMVAEMILQQIKI